MFMFLKQPKNNLQETKSENSYTKGENMYKIIRSKGKNVLVNCDILTSIEIELDVFWEGDVKNLLQWSSVKLIFCIGEKKINFDLDIIFNPKTTTKIIMGTHQLLPDFEKNIEDRLLETLRESLKNDTVTSINLNSILDSILEAQVVPVEKEISRNEYEYSRGL